MPYGSYLERRRVNAFPYLPLEGRIDLTYRCNNNCRHCWLKIPSDTKESRDELSFAEIREIANQARVMGCRNWSISGGEPMLRPDFVDIFDYLTASCNSYSLSTNGTLITPKIARLLKRKGVKMVALYGATAQVHDYITRSPGSYEATMRGFRYLKEAGAGFIVHVIPMRDNYRQFQDMVKIAQSLCGNYKIGAPWLFLSASGSPKRNKEISQQRLPPEEVVKLDKPDLPYQEWLKNKHSPGCDNINEDRYLFAGCINSRRDFHVDPYGKMTFCGFIKDSSLRYDLRKGSFKEAWEEFIPSLANKVKSTKEYRENCGSCELKNDCRICAVHAYLEHRRFNAKVSYLCSVARKNREFKDNLRKNHRRYFKIADIIIRVESDLAIADNTFHPKFKHFEIAPLHLPFRNDDCPKDIVTIRHHFSLPDLNGKDLGKEFYRKPPWAVYKKGDSWVYLGISPDPADKSLHRVVIFNSDHTRARIYNYKKKAFLKGNLSSLTLFPTDQILLARILADRGGCYLHSCGVNFKGKGLIFAGHSEAGKSTMATMLKGKAEILCDDRMIIRKFSNGFRIFGTWSHGDVPSLSANSAPLKAVMFLKKSGVNHLTLLKDKRQITKEFLAYLIRPFVTVDWWEKTLSLIEEISVQVPCYVLEFDKTGKVIEVLKKL